MAESDVGGTRDVSSLYRLQHQLVLFHDEDIKSECCRSSEDGYYFNDDKWRCQRVVTSVYHLPSNNDAYNVSTCISSRRSGLSGRVDVWILVCVGLHLCGSHRLGEEKLDEAPTLFALYTQYMKYIVGKNMPKNPTHNAAFPTSVTESCVMMSINIVSCRYAK